MELDNSILMQKQIRDNSEDLQSEFLDMKNWEEQMKRKEQEILSEHNGQDKACKELENEGQSDESVEEPLSKEELEKNHNKAMEYKEQGNSYVKQKKWGKAIASYSEAIQIFPYDAIFYANRALCHLKQDNLYSAEADCSSAIQLDQTYVKAYHRRVTARLGLKQYKEAMEDVNKIADLEPCSKETEVLLNQVKKQFGNSSRSKIDVCTTEVSDNQKRYQEVIEAKEDKNEKSSINVDNTVKPTTSETTTSATEPKKDRRIPDWLPERDNVEIVEPIDKPPHLRSKEPLKRIPVQMADLSKPLKELFKEDIKATCSKSQKQELSYIRPDNVAGRKESVAICKPKESFVESCKEMPPIPINAVQFLINWKKFTSFDFRYKYLKQIPPGSLSKIFQDSMESDIFSGILSTLKTEFMKRNEPIFSYLKDLSNVKRFRTFIMFISSSEKQDLKLMFSYCITSERIPDEEVTDLQNKYEI
ncbi:PREDICTED: RNA polymerase II-associated protein 3 isoform X2 [Wasmannia auropunctata]|uniref:RNA polymerase II-associated protein 3 isoform X2 n=1 Tax=Wasmannia auropunctata TaxID=64793 RepID=UPI0005EEF1C6|nr:PREDICTED: RNA polymerase II-associated protein 3 isoform X2 [Wasmannia auropunctata]